MYPKVVIIILNVNQKNNTLKCLQSIYQIDYPDYQVLLVDNGSTDGSSKAVSYLFPETIILKNKKNLGASGGRNVGILYANKNLAYDYLLFLDNDTIVEKAFLTELVKYSEKDPKVGVAFPKIYYMDKDHIIQAAGNIKINFYMGLFHCDYYQEKDMGQCDKVQYSMLAFTTCCLVKKRVIEKLKKFDEIYDPYGFEDSDFSLRSNYEGFKNLYVPASVIHHKVSKTPSGGKYNEAYTKLKGRNMKIFMKKHATSFQYLCFLFISPLLGIRTLIREIKNGNTKAAIALFKGFLEN